MIERYAEKEITDLFSDTGKAKRFLEVELALLYALEQEKRIPSGITDKISKAQINLERILEIEKETKHDFVAFTDSITEQFDPKISKYFHFGATSSDIIDTAHSLIIKEALSTILKEFSLLQTALYKKAEEHKYTLTMGRSHGIFAEPTSFGVKLLGHFQEFQRRFKDFEDFFQNELSAKFSGAIGNYTILDTKIEEKAAKKLELKVEEVSTQVIPRDRIAKLISVGALYACALERLCVELRHLQRSEVMEVCEGFNPGQKGSSTMPHKKNPISAENLSGIARIIRSHALVSLENVILWHERDISHSSAERLFLPDHLGLILYSIKKLKNLIQNLYVDKKSMLKKIEENQSFLSSLYLHKLIEHSDLSREEAYKIIQEAFLKPEGPDLMALQKKYSFLKLLSLEEIKKTYTKEVEEIFKRVDL